MRMRILRPSSEAEMIAEFLRQEIASTERYGAAITACLEAEGVQAGIIRQPDITDEYQNLCRRRVFARYRGYGTGQVSYLTGFPDSGVDWQWAALSLPELLQVRYIRYAYWTALSAGTRSPLVAAGRIRQGIEVYGVSNQGFHDLAGAIAGGATLPPLILVTVPDPVFHVALEGNTRLTAYALVPEAIPDEVCVLIGTSPAIARWDEY
jgi:hypothetical protein